MKQHHSFFNRHPDYSKMLRSCFQVFRLGLSFSCAFLNLQALLLKDFASVWKKSVPSLFGYMQVITSFSSDFPLHFILCLASSSRSSSSQCSSELLSPSLSLLFSVSYVTPSLSSCLSLCCSPTLCKPPQTPTRTTWNLPECKTVTDGFHSYHWLQKKKKRPLTKSTLDCLIIQLKHNMSVFYHCNMNLHLYNYEYKLCSDSCLKGWGLCSDPPAPSVWGAMAGMSSERTVYIIPRLYCFYHDHLIAQRFLLHSSGDLTGFSSRLCFI